MRPFPNESSCIPTHPKIDGLSVEKFSEFPWGYGFPKDSVWKTPNPVFVSSNQNREKEYHTPHASPLFRKYVITGSVDLPRFDNKDSSY
jgi:hypothetical protein